MNSRADHALIPLDRISGLLQIEPFFVLLALSIGAWAIYKIFLRNTSVERHKNLTRLFRNLGFYLLSTTILFGLYYSVTYFEVPFISERISGYIGLFALIQGAVLFVKTARILIFEYLFLSHMQVAVPLLLVNLFTLLLILAISAWMISEVFSIRLAPLVATSAVFSIVLGLALQDTLGNLFAGIALQIDKPYELGDWVEIQSSGQKWVGQVQEISWRATVLLGFGNEQITVPNRIVGQAQISNFATRLQPIARSQIFRLGFEADPDSVKSILLDAAVRVSGVRKDVPPIALISETTDSWIAFKLIYFVADFGQQYLVADDVIRSAMESLRNRGIPLAGSRLQLHRVNA